MATTWPPNLKFDRCKAHSNFLQSSKQEIYIKKTNSKANMMLNQQKHDSQAAWIRICKHLVLMMMLISMLTGASVSKPIPAGESSDSKDDVGETSSPNESEALDDYIESRLRLFEILAKSHKLPKLVANMEAAVFHLDVLKEDMEVLLEPITFAGPNKKNEILSAINLLKDYALELLEKTKEDASADSESITAIEAVFLIQREVDNVPRGIGISHFKSQISKMEMQLNAVFAIMLHTNKIFSTIGDVNIKNAHNFIQTALTFMKERIRTNPAAIGVNKHQPKALDSSKDQAGGSAHPNQDWAHGNSMKATIVQLENLLTSTINLFHEINVDKADKNVVLSGIFKLTQKARELLKASENIVPRKSEPKDFFEALLWLSIRPQHEDNLPFVPRNLLKPMLYYQNELRRIVEQMKTASLAMMLAEENIFATQGGDFDEAMGVISLARPINDGLSKMIDRLQNDMGSPANEGENSNFMAQQTTRGALNNMPTDHLPTTPGDQGGIGTNKQLFFRD